MTQPELESVPSSPGGARVHRRYARLLRVGLIAVVAVPAVAVGIYFIRSAEHSATASVAPSAVRDGPVLDGNLIRFSPDFAKRVGLGTVPAHAKELSPLVRVTGTVNYDTRKFAAVGARIAGRVRRVFKVMGDQVREHET